MTDHNADGNLSKQLFLWSRMPVIVQSIITGVIVAAAGTLPWAYLVRLNLDHLPSLPWSVIPAGIYLWLFWKYVRGSGWPSFTSAVRKKTVRANQLNSEVWGAAIIAGILGLASLVIFSGLYSRIVKLPQQDISELSHVPFITVTFMILMGSVVAGIVEESAFRGYMQKPIEQRHGPVLAILITGILFGLMHYSHPETTLSLMPFYFFVAAIYGTLAWLTDSILPGIVLHITGDVFAGLQLLLSGQSEWQQSPTPRPLIWETGADTSFWLSCVGLFVVGAITLWAYKNLAREMKSSAGRRS